MYFLYSLLLFFVMCVYSPFYFVKLRLVRRERLYFRNRLGFGLPSADHRRESIWIHAVSVGEVLSLRNLIAKLRARHPDLIIHFSALTHSGYQIAKTKLAGVDNFIFVPLDFKCIVNRFFNKLQPTLFILAESEFWPNLLRVAKKRCKATLLVNGRISQRSARRYRKHKFFTSRNLKNIDLFLVQTEREKEILQRLDVDRGKIEVGGNLKAEIELPIFTADEFKALKKEMNIKDTHKIFVAGSTHRGEEEQLLSSFVKAREKREDIRLILAPRHLDRVEEVERLCAKYDLKFVRRTSIVPGIPWNALILDTLGELAQFYALSDVAFVGGSLIPWGGQNLLEPAFYGKPIYIGPHMDNFSFLAEKFIESGSARMIHEQADIDQMFLAKDFTRLYRMGSKAKETLASLGGATEKTVKAIERLLTD